MKTKVLFFLAIGFFLISLPAYAAIYHIDPDAAGGGDGSATRPYNSWWNLPSMKTGDDVYFKCNTVYKPPREIFITWEGTSANPVVIGSYYMENNSVKYGVKGNRPIISGSGYTVPENKYFGSKNIWRGLINVQNRNYVHIKNLHVYQSGFQGINISGNKSTGTNSAHFLIQNVKVEGTYNSGINIVDNPYNYGIIENNEISGANFGWYKGSSEGILKSLDLWTWAASISLGHCAYGNATVRKNYIHDSWGEGIMQWTFNTKNSGHDIIEDNLLFNVHAVGIYLCNTNNTIVRRNLVLGAGPGVADNRFFRITSGDRKWNGPGIRITGEKLGEETGLMADEAYNIYIYNNSVAGMASGISIASEHSKGNTLMKDIFVYNNTLIANSSNIGMGYLMRNYTTKNIEFKNNISYCPPGDKCSDVDSNVEMPGFAEKFTWNYNAWTAARKNAAGPNDVLVNNNFVKTKGWQNLTNPVDIKDFAMTAGNPAINKGAVLKDQYAGAEYKYAIDTVLTSFNPYSSSGISVKTIPQSQYGTQWDMGATAYQNQPQITNPVTPLTPPRIFNVEPVN